MPPGSLSFSKIDVIFAQGIFALFTLKQRLAYGAVGKKVAIIEVLRPYQVRNRIGHQFHQAVQLLLQLLAFLKSHFGGFLGGNVVDYGIRRMAPIMFYQC